MPDDIFKRTSKAEEDFLLKDAVRIILEKMNNITEIPNWRKRGRLILISKKGTERAELDDTRPIIINRALYKTLERSICDIRQQLWPLMFKGQNEFRPGASTQDNITLVRQWMNSRIRRRKPSVIFNIDIKKAFDHVLRTILLEKRKGRINENSRIIYADLINNSEILIGKEKIGLDWIVITHFPGYSY